MKSENKTAKELWREYRNATESDFAAYVTFKTAFPFGDSIRLKKLVWRKAVLADVWARVHRKLHPERSI